MESTNLSKIKREKMLNTINEIKKNITDENILNNLSLIENELTKKKYGLIWEEHEERVDKELKTKIPVFEDVIDKEIVSNKNAKFNFLLEGDNLHSLYLLEKTHKGRIDIIYIDPPYNTGKEFIYNDDIVDASDGYKHSKWLSFMERRLKFAKTLLNDQGVIFISIDDNEQANLKLLCDEIMGEENFIANIIWEKAYSPVNLKKHFSENHDYILCYAKNINFCKSNGLKRSQEANSRYKNIDNDPRGPWKPADSTVGPAIKDRVYELTTPSGRKVMPPSGRCWLYTKEKFDELIKDNRIWFGKNGNNVPAVKKFLSEVKGNTTPMTIWKYTEVGHSQEASQELKKLFDGISVFDYPKSVPLIKRMISLYSNKNSIILDFFAGSGTTAQAVVDLNKEDGGNRKFILCTNNENNICEEVTYKRLVKINYGTPRIEPNKFNLKYYKTSYIPRINTDEENLSKNLMINIKNLIQLENGISVDDKMVKIFLEEDKLDEFSDNQDELDICNKIYISSDILLTSIQEKIFKENNIEVYIIPEYYFKEEIMEVA